MSVAQAQEDISSWEFVQWVEYLKRKAGRANIEVMQMASVQAEIRSFRNSFMKDPPPVNVNEFIVKPVFGSSGDEDGDQTQTSTPVQDSKPNKASYDITWRDKIDPRTLPPEQQEAYKKRVAEEDKVALAGALFMVPGFLEQLNLPMPGQEQGHGDGQRPDAGT